MGLECQSVQRREVRKMAARRRWQMNRIPTGAKGIIADEGRRPNAECYSGANSQLTGVSSSSSPGLGLKAKPTGETIPVVAK
jgi:hypothetical protein